MQIIASTQCLQPIALKYLLLILNVESMHTLCICLRREAKHKIIQMTCTHIRLILKDMPYIAIRYPYTIQTSKSYLQTYWSSLKYQNCLVKLLPIQNQPIIIKYVLLMCRRNDSECRQDVYLHYKCIMIYSFNSHRKQTIDDVITLSN